MARLMLERQAKVIIWDINQASIDETLSAFSGLGTITGFNVDVSNVDQIEEKAKEVGVVDVLINNAGIVVGKYFNEHSVGEISKTVDINVSAPMYVAKAFLEGMLNQNSGHICNIASSGGLISNPKMAVYAASKWAVVGWSDSLRLEMEQMGKDVRVTTIMPYYINTGMFDGVKSKIPILDPEVAALTIVKAIENNRIMLTIPGYIYRLTRFSQGVLPFGTLGWVMDSVLGIYKTMEHFTGRK